MDWQNMLQRHFATWLEERVPLAPFTSARIGGLARFLVTVTREQDAVRLFRLLWEENAPYFILGGGSNLLVADEGFPGVVVRNRVRGLRWLRRGEEALLWAAAGEPLTPLAVMTVEAGYQGLEWAVGIPGTLGGAVVGNAGAFGGDIARVLVYAEVLHRELGRLRWTPQDLEMRYRTTRIKARKEPVVVLAAVLRLSREDPVRLREQVARYREHRRRTQPAGASMGSMFKNPPGDYAGRLIEAAGLKGTRIGDAEISPLHANFFINHGQARARDVWMLMRLAQKRVWERFGIWLEPEVELVGAWPVARRALLFQNPAPALAPSPIRQEDGHG